MARKISKPKPKPEFDDVQRLLRPVGGAKSATTYQAGDVIFAQGDVAECVYYVQRGAVRLSVVSRGGKDAVIGTLEPGHFFGEAALAGHSVRLQSATALTEAVVMIVEKRRMARLLHEQQALADRFIMHMLARNIRIEGDLVDQLFNSSEKRLARALLLLARYGNAGPTHSELPRISQGTLAEMIGTTRPRVNFFMNKFKRLGFIEYGVGLKVNHSLLTVVLHD